MKKLSLVLVTMVVLGGCAKEAEQSEIKGAGGFQVERLFTHEGCTVFRFRDAGERIYYSTCEGSVSRVTSRQCGKVRCSHVERTQTVLLAKEAA